MESDRGAALTIRAASRGLIDFRQARLLDPDWWKYCRLIFQGIVWDDDRVLQDAIYRFHLSLVSNSGLTEESFAEAQKNAQNGFYDVVGLLRPWAGVSAAERQTQEVDTLKKAYEEAFGRSLDDPEFIKQEEEAVARWRADRAQQRDSFESEEDRVRRLRAESKERIRKLHDERLERIKRQGR